MLMIHIVCDVYVCFSCYNSSSVIFRYRLKAIFCIVLSPPTILILIYRIVNQNFYCQFKFIQEIYRQLK
jgi:hypothetical protein